MGFNLKRFKEVAKPASAKEREEAEFREENRDWLLKSSLIALEIRRYLRVNEMNQNHLAEMLGISPAMVTKLLSGKENLSLKTICGIEKVTHLELLNIPCEEKNVGTFVVWNHPNTANKEMEFEGGQTYCKVVNINDEFAVRSKKFVG